MDKPGQVEKNIEVIAMGNFAKFLVGGMISAGAMLLLLISRSGKNRGPCEQTVGAMVEDVLSQASVKIRQTAGVPEPDCGEYNAVIFKTCPAKMRNRESVL